jgi:hypothetical protein
MQNRISDALVSTEIILEMYKWIYVSNKKGAWPTGGDYELIFYH